MIQPLNENNICAALVPGQYPTDSDEYGNQRFDLQCNGTIYGRYLTVQKMGCGILELSEITIYPSPSEYLITTQFSQFNCWINKQI